MWSVAPSAAVPAVLTTSIVGATSTKVVACAVLLVVFASFADETVALFVIKPSVEGAVTMIEKLAAVFAAIDALVHVTLVVAVGGQVQPAPLALTKVTPLGKVSVTLTVEAAVVRELFVTAIAYVKVPPEATGSGESVLVMLRSAVAATAVNVAVIPESLFAIV
jgi:hypothetical protein